MATSPSEGFYKDTIREEGKRLIAYLDLPGTPGAKWTIGFGNTTMPDGSPVKQGDTITEDQAVEMFRSYVQKKIQPYLDKLPRLTQNEVDALASLAYNSGPGILAETGSTLGKTLHKMQTCPPDKIPQFRTRAAIEIMRWIFDENRKPTLKDRRYREALKFAGEDVLA